LVAAAFASIETQINLNFDGLIPAQEEHDDTPVEVVCPDLPEIPECPDLVCPEVKTVRDIAYGPAQSLYGWDSARSYYEQAEDGTPLAIGIEISENAPKVMLAKSSTTSRTVFLLSPDKARVKTPFQWITITWNFAGHGPANVWDVPHFDTHFYFTSPEEAAKITTVATPDAACPGATLSCDNWAKALQEVAAKYYPAGWVRFNNPRALMGDHFYNPATAIPGSFTSDFLFGAFGGSVNFYEPMATPQFLQEKTDHCSDIAEVDAFQFSGWYPTQWCVKWDADRHVHIIEMNDFEWREGDF